MDHRSFKTEQKLFKAYTDLLQKEASEKITVRLLTDTASIHRVTFYKHYNDFPHFQEHFITTHIESLYTFMKPLNYKTYEKGFEYEHLVLLLTHIASNRPLYATLFAGEHLPEFNKRLLSYFQSQLTKHTEELAKFDFPGINVDQEIVAWYGVSALFGTIILWAQSGFKYTPLQLAQSITKLTPINE